MRHTLLALASVLASAVATLAFAQAPNTTTLALEVPDALVQGQSATLRATLSDGDGAPITGAPITFWVSLHFFDHTDTLRLGTARTNFRGVASLTFNPTIDGRRHLAAAFEGSADLAPSEASLPVTVASGVLPEAARPAAPVLPWMTRSRTVALLLPAILGVWIIFGYALYQMTSIAAEGRRPSPAHSTEAGT